MSAGRHHHAAVLEGAANAATRDLDEEADSQRPSKRAKYASVACVQCKRRKAKCVQTHGKRGCERCRAYGEDCAFPETQPSQSLQSPPKDRLENVEVGLKAVHRRLDLLQRDVQLIRQTHSTPGGDLAELAPSMISSNAAVRTGGRRQLAFVGRTQPDYSFGVARQSMAEHGLVNDVSGFASPEPSAMDLQLDSSCASDPLSTLSRDDLLGSIATFREEVDPVYPFVDVEALLRQVESLFPQSTPSGMNNAATSTVAFPDPCETVILRVAVAVGRVIQSLGADRTSQQLVESVENQIFGVQISSEALYTEAVATTLMSLYHFHADEELLAWRTIRFAASMALELGLHRQESLVTTFPNEEERCRANRLFWCIYVLDRRWSFGTSLPFALQDGDIDPELLEPQHSAEYLQCMIKYGRLCSKVWQAFPNFGSPTKAIPEETTTYLEFQIHSWRRAIPQHLRLVDSAVAGVGADRIQRRLTALLYLRGNQMQILINRHHVLSTSNIQQDMEAAKRVVDLARDGIQVLKDLNESSDIYMRQQVAFNYFLVSALAVIFLAVCHEPASFRVRCRDSFYDAVELVRHLSAGSRASKRLWKSVRALRPQAQRLGLHRPKPSASRDTATAIPTPATAPEAGPERSGTPRRLGSASPLNETSLQEPRTGSHGPHDDNLNDEWQQLAQVCEELDATSHPDPDIDQMSFDLANWYATFDLMGEEGNDMAPTSWQGNGSQHEEFSRLFNDLIVG